MEIKGLIGTHSSGDKRLTCQLATIAYFRFIFQWYESTFSFAVAQLQPRLKETSGQVFSS